MSNLHKLTGCLLLSLVPLSGCAPKRADMLHFLRQHEHEVSAMEYRVGIPDTISISAPRVLEVDGESQRIQPDGKISLRLLGEVRVVGMTAREIAAKLEVLLSRYYLDPLVRVTVSYDSKIYYIVNQAGAIAPRPYSGRDTLLDAVVSAGVDFRSLLSNVRVLRPTPDQSPIREITVDVDDMVRRGDWSQNILLEPDDIVVIPPTVFSWFGQRIRELLYPVGPALQLYTTPGVFMDQANYYSEEQWDSATNSQSRNNAASNTTY
ncbi:MAG: polysaccharide biosynthesis/export family protein [Planctomycetota bacterium]|jgi:polysaccharide export outer membrane protein